MNILLPINPEFIEKIFTGEKRYEYRKIKPRQAVNNILLYETYPTMKVVGEAKIIDILVDDPSIIWEQTKVASGITKNYYEMYFKNKNKAVAYELGKIIRYEKGIGLAHYGIDYIPQNYVYIEEDKK